GLPPRGGTVASSSSEATESENSYNDNYDKPPSSIIRRNSLPAASTVSCSSSEIDLQHVPQTYDPPRYDLVVNPELLNERRNDETISCSKIYYDQRSDTATRSTRASIPVPRSVPRVNSKFAESLDHLDVNRRRTRGKPEFDASHEHYMVPTHEPNRPSDNRTLSLFNPEFLPNFNDMLMYVRPDADLNVSFPTWNSNDFSYGENNTSITRESLNSDASVDSRFIGTSSSTRDASYTSLNIQDRLNHVTGVLEKENIYAAVARQEAKRGCNTIEYNC
ncbi:uncharacterized protein, partial [Chelonus insularis]|uniref:uncharacterized protein n=1 Tax=Chelonus insularis TaxID=460826 RepID=UPI00158C9C75